MDNWWNNAEKGELSSLRKACPCAVLPSTDLIWTHVGLNLGFHYEKPVNNHLRYGRAYKVMLIVMFVCGQVTINMKLAMFWNVMLCYVLKTGSSLLHCYLSTNCAVFHPTGR